MTTMMRRRMRDCCLVAFGLLLVLGMAASSQGAVVNGNLDDWGLAVNPVSGITVYNGAYPDGYHPGVLLTPTKGTVNVLGQTVHFAMEDSLDTNNNHQVGPLYGGQNFDAEFLGVAVHDGKLWIAISSGQRPDNGFSNFEPGDIRIKTASKTYGLEVGGGPGSSSLVSGSFLAGANGTTYNLNGSGYVTSVTDLGSSRPAGSLWWTTNDNTQWVQGLPDAAPGLYKYTQVTGGTLVGNVTYDYNYAWSLRQHAWIEASIDLSLLNNETITYVGWSPSCANDSLYLEVQLAPPPAPEPASFLIWGILGVALGGCGWWRHRARRA